MVERKVLNENDLEKVSGGEYAAKTEKDKVNINIHYGKPECPVCALNPYLTFEWHYPDTNNNEFDLWYCERCGRKWRRYIAFDFWTTN